MAMAGCPDAAPAPSAPQLEAVPFTAVRIEDPFWSPRLSTNRTATIPHLLDQCELEGRVRNFWRAAGCLEGPYEGGRRHDADLYKAIEAAACSLATDPDPALQQRVEGIIDAIAAAQQPDGYLDTRGSVGRPPGRPGREPDLFAAGHLLDAAVAWRDATGSARLLDVARRLADRIDRAMGLHATPAFPSHPKIEAALDRLFEATGETRYIELANSFLDERGGPSADARNPARIHNQSHLPVRAQAAAEGHVICALFLCEGMHDVGRRTADTALVEASRRIYQDAITRRFYLTGAMGRADNERFTDPWALDNRASIGEGCQSAGLARLALRRLLIEADACHADVFERVFYNNLLANVGLDGKTFFYVNRLAARPEDATGQPYIYPLTETERNRLPRFCLDRQPWFKVPCCPPNVAMTLAALGQWIYARSDADEIYVNLYIGSRATVLLTSRPPSTESSLESAGPPDPSNSMRHSKPARSGQWGQTLSPGATSVVLIQETRYPWEGRVRIAVEPSQPHAFTLALRVPDWCRDLESMGGLYRPIRPAAPPPVAVRVNGQAVAPVPLVKGYLRLHRQWRQGDIVVLDLPMPVLRIVADPRVTPDAGRAALQRGPIVYCAEAVDHDGQTRHLVLPGSADLAPVHRPDLLGGVTVLCTRPEKPSAPSPGRPALLRVAVPYAVWCNRKPGEMDVWLPAGPPDSLSGRTATDE